MSSVVMFYVRQVFKLFGFIAGLALLLFAGVFIWIGYRNSFFTDNISTLSERANMVISANRFAPFYVIVGVSVFFITGVVVIWATSRYTPRGRGLLPWEDYFK